MTSRPTSAPAPAATPPRPREERTATASSPVNPPDPDAPGIAEAAELLGIGAHTLRYYERAGLVAVDRDASGHRRYSAEALRRLEFIRRMRLSGMGMSLLTRYLELADRGPDTVDERLRVMQAHRASIIARLDELHLALEATDYKIAVYGGALGEPDGYPDPGGDPPPFPADPVHRRSPESDDHQE